LEEPIQVGDAEGFYLLCRLTSDDEPERRVWKMTTRVEKSRGEQLYQAKFELPKTSFDEWNRVLVPFSSFVQVRGPRMVEGAPALNTTNGLFQIGLSLSKFQIASRASELENFRPGFFELQIKEIGVFRSQASNLTINAPTTLTKEDIEKKKPMMLKILFPVVRVLFNENR
jgi:Complex I intermediate-associated protein 30 (CIA30)